MLTTLGLGKLVDPLGGRTLEGSDVLRRSVERAADFAQHNLRRGDRVFLHNGNTLEFFVDLLAAWRLGACVIPIDGRLVTSEVVNLAASARPALSIFGATHDEATVGALRNLGVIALLPNDGPHTPAAGTALPDHSFALDDDALILFTSGTTGDPKGVVHTHRTLRARWMGLHSSLGLHAFRRSLCLLPTHFGHGLICNCLFPWFFGQDLYVLPPFRADLLMNLGGIIDQHEITFMSSVPTVWRLALKLAKPPKKGSMERVFCGSAPLSGQLWRSVKEWTGAKEVMNAYGITETGSWLAGTTVGNVEPEDGLIGKAWGGVMAILPTADTAPRPDFSNACKPNEVGFVWTNTPALMKGYLQRDDLTSKVVVDGWFSTGDLGLLDERGFLYLRGRVRDEINKSGQKIHPTDIDTVIEQFEGTLDVCTFAVPDPLHGEDVGVAVVLETPSDEVLQQLHEWAGGRLGTHQMPKHWYLVTEIPRTSRGKVNRQHVADFCASQTPVPPARFRRA